MKAKVINPKKKTSKKCVKKITRKKTKNASITLDVKFLLKIITHIEAGEIIEISKSDKSRLESILKKII